MNVSKRDIDEIFNEFEDSLEPSDFTVESSFDKPNITAQYGWKLGVVKPASEVWVVFRMRAGTSERLKKFLDACDLINSGEYSIREIRTEIGYATNTIMHLIHKLRAFREKNGMGEIVCPCGKPIVEHIGWCKFRFKKSDKRQEYIKTWGRQPRLNKINVHGI